MTVPLRAGLGFAAGAESSVCSSSSSPKSESAFDVAGVPTSCGSMANMGEWDVVDEEDAAGDTAGAIGKSYVCGSFEKSSSRKREKSGSSAEGAASRLKKSSILYCSSILVGWTS